MLYTDTVFAQLKVSHSTFEFQSEKNRLTCISAVQNLRQRQKNHNYSGAIMKYTNYNSVFYARYIW